jgi:hypothetical protein
MPNDYTIATYYFGNYHDDARNSLVHGPGWTEWELVKRAEPRFPGHVQPHVPLWGYEDESDPQQWRARSPQLRITASTCSSSTGTGTMTDRFSNAAWTTASFNAPNNDRLKFGLMWANHDWVDIHPIGLSTVRQPPLLYRRQGDPGDVRSRGRAWSSSATSTIRHTGSWTAAPTSPSTS